MNVNGFNLINDTSPKKERLIPKDKKELLFSSKLEEASMDKEVPKVKKPTNKKEESDSIEKDEVVLKELKVTKDEVKEQDKPDKDSDEEVVEDNVIPLLNLKMIQYEKESELTLNEETEEKEDHMVDQDHTSQDEKELTLKETPIENKKLINIGKKSNKNDEDLIGFDTNLIFPEKENESEPVLKDVENELVETQEFIKENKGIIENDKKENIFTKKFVREENKELGKQINVNRDQLELQNKESDSEEIKLEINVDSEAQESSEEVDFEKENNTSFKNIFFNLEEGVLASDLNIDGNIKKTPLERKEFLQEMVKEIKFTLEEGKNQVKMKLTPETLGELTLQLEVNEGMMSAKALVDNYKAKEMMEANMVLLQKELEKSGMEIKSFEVFVGNNDSFEKHESGQFQGNKKKKINLKNKTNKKLSTYEEASIEKRDQLMGNYIKGSFNILA